MAPVLAAEPTTASIHNGKPIIWFDIDNTLYPASSRIDQLMGERIRGEPCMLIPSSPITFTHANRRSAYFRTLGLDEEEAGALHLKYYREYGLAIRGLTRHHTIGTAHPTQSPQSSSPSHSWFGHVQIRSTLIRNATALYH